MSSLLQPTFTLTFAIPRGLCFYHARPLPVPGSDQPLCNVIFYFSLSSICPICPPGLLLLILPLPRAILRAPALPLAALTPLGPLIQTLLTLKTLTAQIGMLTTGIEHGLIMSEKGRLMSTAVVDEVAAHLLTRVRVFSSSYDSVVYITG